MNTKLLLTLILASSYCNVFSQSDFDANYLKDGTYIFDDTVKIYESTLFPNYKTEFGLGINDEMVKVNTETDKEGNFHSKYVQYYKGYEVERAWMNVIGQHGIVLRVNGFVVKDLNLDVNQAISESDALNQALTYIDAEEYLWENEAQIENHLENTGDFVTDLFPKGKLLITKKSGDEYAYTPSNFRLCWSFQIQATDPSQLHSLNIDAISGEVFDEFDPWTHDQSVIGSVITWYEGLQSLATATCTFCTQYKLRDIGRNIYTYNWSDNGNIWKDNNNQWYESNPDHRTPASAHWQLQKAYDYYLNRHGRWGADYNGREVNILTDYCTSCGSAYGLNSGKDVIYIESVRDNHPITALDILAHEYTHAMIDFSSGLDGSYEASALNEGFADIFGMRIEQYTLGYTDWSIGEDYSITKRLLDEPHNDIDQYLSEPSPAIYIEPGFWSGSDKHRDGGVVRKWFYLLSQGGPFNNINVVGLGIERADDIAYITFNWWLWPNVNYTDAGHQAAEAAAYHYGECSQDHKSTRAAWRAVGINFPPLLCPKLVIDGNNTIHFRQAEPIAFDLPTRFTEPTPPGGTYQWVVPPTWQVSNTNQSTLHINNVTDTASRIVTVTYTPPSGNPISDDKVVHFTSYGGQPRMAIESPLKTDLIVYPNPAYNKITLFTLVPFENATVVLFDLYGREVYTASFEQLSETQIDLDHLGNGTYLLLVKTSEMHRTKVIQVIK